MKQKTPPTEPTQAETHDTEAVNRLFTFRFETKFENSVDSLPNNERQVLNALRRFYAYRHNGFLLVEALDTCTRHKANPPTWVLEAINEAFQEFNEGYVTLERALLMGKRDREEYSQYRQQQPLMAEVRERINSDLKRDIRAACTHVANRNDMEPSTLEKQYRRMWLGFYDYVKGK